MMNPFNKSKLLSEEDEYFQFECFRWLLKHFGGEAFYKESVFALPTSEYFPQTVDSNESAAEATFSQVLKHAGMETWPIELVDRSKEPDPVVGENSLAQGSEQTPDDRASANEKEKFKISYSPEIVSDPLIMVAAFAHNISRFLTAHAPEPPPGGWENREFASDIAATFIGFGVFQANASYKMRRNCCGGWHGSRLGYLTEAEHSYALAIYLRLKSIEPSVALPHCGRNVSHNLKRALKELDASEVIDDLREVKFEQPNSQENSLARYVMQ